jgi:hypothetical protein
MGADRSNLHVGPIQPTIVEGLRVWRHVLTPNEWGISYDLTFRDTFRQEFRERRTHPSAAWPAGRRPDITSGFEGFGVVDGWVQIDERRIELDPSTCSGTRDRHWGLGRDVGGPALQVTGAPSAYGLSGNNFVAFDSWALWGDSILYPLGDPRSRADRVVRMSRRLRFEPETRLFLEGIIDYSLATGGAKQLHYRRIGDLTAYMRCGMYGGTPVTQIHQGARLGNHVEGDRFDVRVPEIRTQLAGLDEHLCEVTCGEERAIGIYQPIDPDAYEACQAGQPGWDFL